MTAARHGVDVEAATLSDDPDKFRSKVEEFLRDSRSSPDRRDKAGHVYFILFDGFVKIGWTIRPTARLNEIANILPRPAEVLGVYPGTRIDEARLHRKFADQRAVGEWFAVSEEILVVAKAGFGTSMPPTADGDRDPLIVEAIDAAGSENALANALGCKRSKINKMKRLTGSGTFNCSSCGKSHSRAGQRHCASCHSLYMRAWREKRRAEVVSLVTRENSGGITMADLAARYAVPASGGAIK